MFIRNTTKTLELRNIYRGGETSSSVSVTEEQQRSIGMGFVFVVFTASQYFLCIGCRVVCVGGWEVAKDS